MRPCINSFGVSIAARNPLLRRASTAALLPTARCTSAAPRTSLSRRQANFIFSTLPLPFFSTPRVMSPVLLSAGSKRGMHAQARPNRAFIALGSNLGDRVGWIEQACNAMERDGDIRIRRTSSLWETKAMYVLDQDNFVNGACEIETCLAPTELLDKLQSVENELGRVKVVDKGPRNIDLDILLYNDEIVSTNRLQVPHPLMLEREFVLRPLCELIPNDQPPKNKTHLTYREFLKALPPVSDPISTLTPLAPGLPPLTSLHGYRNTQVMSILNVTPDSFSDGGDNSPSDHAALQATVKTQIMNGATILDIGGQSTRPNAELISPSEELARVLPAVSAIRSLPEASNAAISVDTFYSSVAEAAIKAGAHIINDVSGGALDQKMLSTAARLGCTICLMHMRGTPKTMNKLTNYPNGVIEGVAHELLETVKDAEDAGVRRWRIILDPGLGFAKTQAQNLELLRRLDELRNWDGLEAFPWLVGPSRKGFVGTITGVKEAKDRTWGTAAAVTASVQGGADIVRVHDVGEMAKVVKMADAIWRY